MCHKNQMDEVNSIDFFTDLTRVKNGAEPALERTRQELASGDSRPEFSLSNLLDQHAEEYAHTPMMHQLIRDLQNAVIELRQTTTLAKYIKILRFIKFAASETIVHLTSPLLSESESDEDEPPASRNEPEPPPWHEEDIPTDDDEVPEVD